MNTKTHEIRKFFSFDTLALWEKITENEGVVSRERNGQALWITTSYYEIHRRHLGDLYAGHGSGHSNSTLPPPSVASGNSELLRAQSLPFTYTYVIACCH
ncbi:unnamed protein product [Ceratitis capitata]|uniref:(Mediterranean fruit fly) hypothetical protein n=1 Tax=Ceratitis capitata TaxID=7213 RepID=A0A811UA62_CERCA|nr:unnamed protein product [Ceratitis capitata]